MSRSRAKDVSIIDVNIGKKIHELRLSSGKTRQELGLQIGVTHQQLQKYENGINRISAGRLYEISKLLNVNISYFFKNAESPELAEKMKRQRLAIDVMKDFIAIDDPEKQNAIRQMIKVLNKG